MKNGLTVSAIFEASSLNYGEGMGNITSLKHITRECGEQYTYMSRQALRYNFIEQLNCDNTPVEANGSGEKKVIQFAPETNIRDYPEIDLFGYMKTTKGNNATTRSAVVRLTNAVSLEPFHADLDFLTNMGLARRCDADNSIAQSELHKSFYAYTITIDLDRIGVDTNTGTELDNAERARRVCALLQTAEFLYRDIKGRRENLAPVFILGGVYARKSPFFENRLRLEKGRLNVQMIQDVMEAIGEETNVGYLPGTFHNDAEIREKLPCMTISAFFKKLCAEVEQNYGV
ncbi:type I-B CRISPR-associated protein Cas7/Cst2/DevR [Butyricicoccus sp.]|uniref:type I-B CRISPR-associated protein Cas7/Cst2/DevR n=1 Tax=Butyricicoccus sp. TaxID=2049021 RepID=UPI003D7DC9FC